MFEFVGVYVMFWVLVCCGLLAFVFVLLWLFDECMLIVLFM